MNLSGLISLTLAFTLIANSLPVRADDPPPPPAPNRTAQRIGSIARPLSKYALKKMGTPGFAIAKFMTYRKIMNGPRCTASQKLHFVGNLLTLAGDITNHVLSLKYSNDLKKDFAGHTDEIKGYLKVNKDLLKVSKETGEKASVQALAFDYAIESEEFTRKRLLVLEKFKYPALGMFLASNILNAKEALTEANPGFSAAVQSCLTAYEAAQVPAEVATTAAGDAARLAEAAAPPQRDAPPWFVRPFLFLANIVKSGTSTMSSRDRNGQPNETRRQYEGAGGVGALTSANYAEEVVVGIVASLKKDTGKGIVNDIKNQAVDIGIRLGVRAAIKANIAAVNRFMRSPPGRGVVYTYNVWVIYSEFDQLRDQIHNAKVKAGALRDAKAEIMGPQTVKADQVEKDFEMIFNIVLSELIAEAHAAVPEGNIGPVKMCLGADTCSAVTPFFEPQMDTVFKTLSPAMQKTEVDLLNKSYIFQKVSQFRKGFIPIQDLNVDEMKKEIATLETEAESLTLELERRNILTRKQLELYENEFVDKDYQWYAALMVPGFNQPQAQPLKLGDFEMPDLKESSQESTSTPDEKKSALDKTLTVEKSPVNGNSSDSQIDAMMEKNDFEFDDIHQDKSGDIWSIITNRYRRSSLQPQE